MLGVSYNFVFYYLFMSKFTQFFVYLNYLNAASLVFNSIFGIFAVCNMSAKMSLIYYVITNYILKANIAYQLIRLVLIFLGEIISGIYLYK